MIADYTTIMSVFLEDFRRDYESNVYETEEDLITAYKMALKFLVKIDAINLIQSNEIAEKLKSQMLYFKEWY